MAKLVGPDGQPLPLPESQYVEETGAPVLVSSGMLGTGYIYRDTWKDAKISPSPDPTNPYKNTNWKFGSANSAWSNMRGCRKDWFNHSWKYRKMKDIEDDKGKFIQSGALMGVNSVLDTLNPEDGSYWVPDCWCHEVVRHDGLPYNSKGLYLHGAYGAHGQTSYKRWVGAKERFGAAWDPHEGAFKVTYRTSLGRSRVGQGFTWNWAWEKPTQMAVWFPFWFKNITGSYHLWDCNKWIFREDCLIKSCKQNCFTVEFYPHGDPTGLCNYVGIEVSLCYGDGDGEILAVGGDTGEMFDLYWLEEKLGSIGTHSDGDGKSIHRPVIGTKFLRDVGEIPWKEHFQPCREMFESKLKDAVTGPGYESGTYDCGDDTCVNNLVQYFQITSDLPDVAWRAGMTWVARVNVSKCECGHWQCWWPCGGVQFQHSSNGVGWGDFGGFPDIVFELGTHKYCFYPINPPGKGTTLIRARLGTGPWFAGCVCAKINGLSAYWYDD